MLGFFKTKWLALIQRIRRILLRLFVIIDIEKDLRIRFCYYKKTTGSDKMIVIQDNECCPCGSGMVFKDCCKLKSMQSCITNTNKPINIYISEEFRKTKNAVKECLHPIKRQCSGKIINAHAIQNNKVLSLLANKDNYVYLIDHSKAFKIKQDTNGCMQAFGSFIKVVCSKATTQMCFCSYHDSELFKAIENKAIPFDEKNERMIFLYAYRAFIFQYAKDKISFETQRMFFKDNYPNIVISEWAVNYHNLLYRLNDLEENKKVFDSHIVSGNYDCICACIRTLPYKISFAINAFFSPSFDLNGKLINNTDSKGIIHGLGVSVFPEETKSYILLSCQKRDIKLYARLFKQIKKASEERVVLYFNYLLPMHSENIVVSEKLLNSFSNKEKQLIEYDINYNDGQSEFLKLLRFGKVLRITARNPSSVCGKRYNLFKQIR